MECGAALIPVHEGIGFLGALVSWIRSNVVAALIIIPLVCISAAALYVSYLIITQVVPVWTSTYLAEKTQFKRALASYGPMSDLLSRTLTQYHASRVGLFRFHNGSRDVFQTAFYFVSVDTMVGTSVDLPSLTDVKAAVYSPIFPALLKGQVWSSFTRDMHEGALKDLTMKRGDRYVAYVPIQDLNGNLAGILGLFWLIDAECTAKNLLDDRMVCVPISKNRDAMFQTLSEEANIISGYFLWAGGGTHS